MTVAIPLWALVALAQAMAMAVAWRYTPWLTQVRWQRLALSFGWPVLAAFILLCALIFNDQRD